MSFVHFYPVFVLLVISFKVSKWLAIKSVDYLFKSYTV